MLNDNNRQTDVPRLLQNADNILDVVSLEGERSNQRLLFRDFSDRLPSETENFYSVGLGEQDTVSDFRTNFECEPSSYSSGGYVQLARQQRPLTFDMDRKKKFMGRIVQKSNNGINDNFNRGAGEGTSQNYEMEDNYKDPNKNQGKDSVTNLTSNSGQKTIDVDPMQQFCMRFFDDMRISKMLRRLCNENNPTAAIKLCEKLQMVILDTQNAAYIRRVFDFLAESLISVFEQGPAESLGEVAKVFGMFGYVIRHDFPIYKNWIFKTYEARRSIRVHLMRALKVTITYDAQTLDLSSYSDRLIISLKDLLEVAETATNFIAVSDTIGEFAKNYKKSFEKHFTDIVDIVVGWHLETEQSSKLKQHCSEVLQQFTEFFIKDLDFTLGLLGQFLEDIIAFGEDIENFENDHNKQGSNRKSPNFEKSVPPEISVGSFIGAFNSVLKCLTNSKEIIAFQLDQKLLDDAVETIVLVAYQSLQLTSCQETVQSINEFLVLILNCEENFKILDMEKIVDIVELEIRNFHNFESVQISSLLILLLVFVKKLQADIPIEFVTFLVEPRRGEEFYTLKLTQNKKHFMAIIKLYHEILNIKNVPLLQEAYKHILTDVNISMKAILNYVNEDSDNESNDDSMYTTLSQAECILNFYLISISVLATQTSSIIGMYALQPSILELLIVKLLASDLKIWSKSPTLHDSIIRLLAIHSIKNNNFVSTSNLLTNNNLFSKLSLDDSPTSENFTLILKFFSEILEHEPLSIKTTVQLLEWLNIMLKQCVQHAIILKDNHFFINIGKNLGTISTRSTSEVTIKCGDCIETLLKYDQINSDVLNSIGEICYIHMSNAEYQIRDCYTQIFGRLPLAISFRQAYETTGVARLKDIKLNDLQHWYVSSAATSANLREKYFKDFIGNMMVNESTEFMENYLKHIFTKCWTVKRGRPSEFYTAALTDLKCLLLWAQWEAAQYCVNNKLRTTLGKPQETFLRIEAIIKEGAKILAIKDNSTIKGVQSLVCNQKHTRILLGFLECLEKAIYNASEGTAFGMPAPEKPARTFFRVNASTCNEWFSRIRHAIDLLAMHNMEPEMVIRCSELTLRNLVNTGRKNEPIFEHTIVTYVRALLKCAEADGLYGLYIWVKQITGKRLTWIKTAGDQASGRREKAAESYLNMLAGTNKDEKFDVFVSDLVKDQIIDCLYFTGQWNELKQFLQENHQDEDNSNKETISSLLLTPSQINFFILLERGHHNDAEYCNPVTNLTDWEVFDNNENIPNNFSYNKTLSIVENTLAALILKDELFDEGKWRICTSIIQSGIQECARTKSREHINNLIILNHIAQNVYQLNTDSDSTLKSLKIDRNYGSITFTRILRWIDYFNYRATRFSNDEYNNLRLNLASMARNEGNLKFSRRELEKFFKRTKIKDLFTIQSSKDHYDEVNLEKVFDLVVENNYSNEIWTDEVLHGLYESSKWLFCQPEKQNEAIQLAATSCLMQLAKINENPTVPNLDISQRISRTLLKLADWLSQSNENILNEEKPIKELLVSMPEIVGYVDEKIVSLIPKLDVAIGKFVQYSVKLCTDLPKAWGAMGNWYYRWGRKVVEARNEADINKAGLGTTDIETIHNFVPNATEEDVEKIVAVLNQHQVTPDDEEIGPNDTSSTEVIENQLRNIEILSNVSSLVIQSIVSIWRRAHKNVYIYYEIAADAYFNYLQLESIDTNGNNAAPSRGESADCSIVTATLRLLRLVVKHAFGLQEVLEEGLAKTPTRPWKVIIPQLFSRLNHHEPYVRKRVSELLCRVAKDSPHLIIFPAVVGAAQEQQVDDFLEDGEKIGSKDENNRSQNTALSFCFNALLDTLSKQAPETVDQVQLLVRELKRVTLLWDESWLHSLAQLYSEYSELFNTIEAEAHKTTDEKLAVLTEKHRVLMNHVINDMKRLHQITSRPAETNYERNFQERFSKTIEHAIEDLKKPFNREKPNESWQRIKQLYAVFQQKLQKSSQANLKMADISPILANMKNTAISMPGVETDDNKQIYIKSVDNVVYILPTKTKPKKLAFFGSDGKRYTYLFKGLEDLHLDERIMQFLSISNSMMTKSNDCNGNVTTYHAHHYSVIPLGPRSGLISWVDGVTPMFAVYKKWQQREAANPKKDKQFRVMRPSEMFYNKLTPLLAEHNLKTTDNRKQWPIAVLKKVLEELSSETPRDLLAKELWCCSTNAAAWRQSVRNFSLSAAVMSVIGYVIGLGDRHLDNVLVKYTTGDIVHIDYNVCFEKGKTLRVPEKVPFRMTPNIEEALGVTGIEGTFRLTCEHVLKTLRKERETLLTLLEAFVYDPLVDWAVGDDGTAANTRTTTSLAAAADISAIGAAASAAAAASSIAAGGNPSDAGNAPSSSSSSTTDRKQSRKKMENEAIRDTLALRFAEIKPEWTQYRDEMNEQLFQMTQFLDELENQRKMIQTDEAQRDLLSKQMAMVREVETLGTAMSSHALSTLSQRYSIYRKAYEEFDQVKKIILQKINEYQTKDELYFKILTQIENDRLKELQFELDKICQHQIENEFDMTKEFLENSAQKNLYLQADQARKELDTSFLQQSFMVKLGIDALAQYESVIKYFPRSLQKKHRLVKYVNWFQELANSPDACKKILKEFPNMLTEERQITSEHAVPYAYELEKLWIDVNINFRKSYDLLQSKFPDINKQGYQESLESISLFLRVENGSENAMKCVISASICEINSRYIQFEERCIKSTHELLLYQSTPDWILDEQSTYLGLVLETTKILSQNSEIFEKLTPYFDNINSIFIFIQTLKDLETCFHAKIIPKLLQAIISENEIMIDTIEEVIKIQNIFDFDLLMNKLLNNIDCHDELEIVKRMYTECKRQLSDGNEMYLVFDNIESTFEILNNAMEKCQNIFISYLNSNNYENLDHVFKSRELAIQVFNQHPINNLEQRFEARKLQTIVQTFILAAKMSKSMRENDMQMVFDNRIILQPITNLINDYVHNCLLGLGSYFVSILEVELLTVSGLEIPNTEPIRIENLILHNVEENQRKETFSVNIYSYAQTMCSSLNTVVKEKILINNLERAISMQNETLNILRGITSIHYWLNENILSTQPIFNHIIYKQAILSTLKSTIHNLNAWKISIEKINDELIPFVQAVAQRLKWAAGANQSLVGLQNAFNDLVIVQENKYKHHCKISAFILQCCSSIIGYESFLPGSSELTENDQQFLFIIEQLDKTYTAHKSTSTLITQVEEALVRLLDPEGTINHIWIGNVSGLLDDMTDTIQTNIAELEKDLHTTQDNLQMTAHKLRALMESELRMDVRYLLKLILKIDGGGSIVRNKHFQSNYKQFLSRISDLHIKILSKDFTEENLKDIRELIISLQSELEKIYIELLKLIANKNSQDDMAKKDKIDGKDGSSGTPVRDSKKGNQPEQKRNAYAVSVWRRIRMKLEGRDPDPNRRLTIAEQVDWMIREAMNPDNLAVLYEGWTPWV